MARKVEPISVKGAVLKLQLSLLDGVQSEAHLFAAGSVISRADYDDVVKERSIANLCGYPLCRNPLPSDPPRKGRYRISLKEHKVYDLTETDLYCSSHCVLDSKAFAGSLHEERCAVVNSEKLEEVMRMFEDLSLEGLEAGDLGKKAEELKIQENVERKSGEVSFEEWRGSSNAIEGYVPRRDRKKNSNRREASKAKDSKLSNGESSRLNEIQCMGPIIAGDEYSISKTPSGSSETISGSKLEASKGKGTREQGSKANQSKPNNEMDFVSTIIMGEEHASLKASSKSMETASNRKLKALKGKGTSKEPKGELKITEISSVPVQNRSESKDRDLKYQLSTLEMPSASSSYQTIRSVNMPEAEEGSCAEKPAKSSETILKPSLKSAGAKKLSRSVTWADEKSDSARGRDLCEIREMEDPKSSHSVCWTGEKSDSAGSRNLCEIKEREVGGTKDPAVSGSLDMGSNDMLDKDKMLRFASAEACAMALTQAAEAVASGESDASDAVSETGIIILPPPAEVDQEESLEEDDVLEPELPPLKWPAKPGIPDSDIFDSGDSWYDGPPEGFSLALSPFATMWMSLFAWISSSSLAYIYGQDESFHEEYLSVNGREYPRKIVLADGRSSEIRNTLAGCLSRALPGLIADLRLPTPVSSIEQGMGRLLETMSFLDALPAFRMKQWQLVVLLFIEALSVSRIPALTPHMTNRRTSFHKVWEGAHISGEEYELLKDIIIPLGRVPQFSAQSGA